VLKKIAYDTPCTVYILSIKIIDTDYLIVPICNVQFFKKDIVIFFFFFGIRQKTKVPTTNNNIIVQTIEVMSFDKVINSIFKCVLIKTKITITIIDILFLQL